jgi:hypothetical protein
MRFLIKVSIPVEAGNAAAKAGKLGATTDGVSFHRNAGRFADSCYGGAMVPCIQRGRRDSSGNGAR